MHTEWFPGRRRTAPTVRSSLGAFSTQVAWHEATRSEVNGQTTIGTYDAATLPRGRKPGAKWVFSYKTDNDGLLVKPKARLVAKGFSQVQDIDYSQTFAPTLPSASTNILAVVANENGLKICNLDVGQAFVRAKFGPEMYMKLPDGCGDISGKVVRLNRSLYGPKQSGRRWAGSPVETVVKYGMERRSTNPCVFRVVVDGKIEMMMAVHVDEIVIIGPDEP